MWTAFTEPRSARCLAVVLIFAAASIACGDSSRREATMNNVPPGTSMNAAMRTVRIGYLHHSTGEVVWNGGVRDFIDRWNEAHHTDYRITSVTYPATTGGWPRVLHRLARNKYPWSNYPYDYWNLWVNHTGEGRDRGELNLDDLAARYDVIVFKHCFPVSSVKPDDGAPSVSSPAKTLANYKLQYAALKARLHQFSGKRFIVWTGAALPQAVTNADDALRAREFFDWVKSTWDEKGDNVFVWDFHELETEGGLFLKPEYGESPRNAHPSAAFAKRVAPLIGQRIVDVIEGRGDEAGLTGAPLAGRPHASEGSAVSRTGAAR